VKKFKNKVILYKNEFLNINKKIKKKYLNLNRLFKQTIRKSDII
jgi:hypothetical protein